MELTSRDRLEAAEKALKDQHPQGVMQNFLCSVAYSLTVIAEVMLNEQEGIEDLREHARTEAGDEEDWSDVPDEDDLMGPEDDLPDLSSDDEDDTDEED